MALDHARYRDEVNSFFLKSEREESFCIFCEKSTPTHTIFSNDLMTVVLCQCGFVYQKNQPTQKSLNQFYTRSSAMTSWANIKMSPQETLRQGNKFVRAVNLLCDIGAKSVLDIGCGNGFFLSLLSDMLPGANLVGIDQNIDATAVATHAGCNVVNQNIFEFLESDGEKYDAVTLWGVLEHVKSPQEVLKSCMKRLTPNGVIVVCVPNVGSLVVKTIWEKCFTFCPQHLWYFDIRTMYKIFSDVGLFVEVSYTIEAESLPILKHLNGIEPYGKIPEFLEKEFTDEILSRHDSMVLSSNIGYKIVAIGSANECRDHTRTLQ